MKEHVTCVNYLHSDFDSWVLSYCLISTFSFSFYIKWKQIAHFSSHTCHLLILAYTKILSISQSIEPRHMFYYKSFKFSKDAVEGIRVE